MGECLFPSSNDNALSVSQGRTEDHRWVIKLFPSFIRCVYGSYVLFHFRVVNTAKWAGPDNKEVMLVDFIDG